MPSGKCHSGEHPFVHYISMGAGGKCLNEQFGEQQGTQPPHLSRCRAPSGSWCRSILENRISLWEFLFLAFSLTSLFGNFCCCFSCCVRDLMSDPSCQGQSLRVGRLHQKWVWREGEKLQRVRTWAKGENMRDFFCGWFSYVTFAIMTTSLGFFIS